MKINFDKQYLKYSLYAFLTIALSVVFLYAVKYSGAFFLFLARILGATSAILSPFIIGVSIAYLLNPSVRFFGEKFFIKIRGLKLKTRLRNNLSIATTYLILIVFVISIAIYIVPQIAQNMRDIALRAPEYVRFSTEAINDLIKNVEYRTGYDVKAQITPVINNIINRTTEIVEHAINNLLLGIASVTSGIFNSILGLVVAFYLLQDKNSIKKGVTSLLELLFKHSTAKKIESFGREVDNIFTKFLVGRALDSFIIGCICFIGLSLLNIRYALLLSIIVGITNMIPYFGPFIGAIPVIIITFFDSPINALWVALFILALQQFDGLYLGPKIMGDSVGVRPFWIIFSVIVGGRLFGVIGMFLGVPIIAIILSLVSKFMDSRRSQKSKAQ
ncbi:MAG: AI-2E family transporter [Clostridiales bacterium]|nr:AI-2E family transporter [Clostridiales bacterium]